MGDILLATIPAALVLVATLGARFIEHYLQSRREAGRQRLEKAREIRDARRRYRESIAAPIREALIEVHGHAGERWLLDTVTEVTKGGSGETPEMKKLLAELEKEVARKENLDLGNMMIKLVPLVAPITNDSVRRSIHEAFFLASAGKKNQGREKTN